MIFKSLANRGWAWRTTPIVALLALIAILPACRRDPIARRQQFLQSGNRYFEKRQFGEAAIQYQRAIQADPHFAEGFYRLGLALAAQQQPGLAAQALSRSIELDAEPVEPRLRLADLEVKNEQYAEAQKQAEEVLRRDPQNPDAHLVLGQAHLQQKQYPEARSEYERAIKLAPQDPVPYGDLALVELLTEQFTEAEKNFQKAVALKPTDTSAIINLGNFYRSRRDVARAEQVLREGMARNPKDVALPLAVADLYMSQGRTSDARNLLSQVESNRELPDARRRVADFYFDHNSLALALERYQTLLRMMRKDVVVAKRIGECYVGLGRWKDAEAWAAAQDPRSKDLDYHLIRGRAYLGEFRFREAINEFQAVIHQIPNQQDADYWLAQVYFKNGEYEAAKDALFDLLRGHPGYLPALLGLADIGLQVRDSAVALQYSNEIIAHNYWLMDAHLDAGNARLLAGDMAAALKEFEVAAALDPTSARARERIARVFGAQGKSREADQTYEGALTADPTYALALSGLAESLLQQGKAAEARSRIDRQIALEPKAYQLYLVKGNFCAVQKDWACAEQTFTQALALNNYLLDAWLDLAQVYSETDRSSQAIQKYEEIRTKFPEYVPTYILLGEAYDKQGDFERARQTYEDALKVNPDSWPAQNNLAWIYAQHGGPLSDALRLAQRARTQRPDDPHVADTLAWVYYKQGLYPSAVQLLEFAAAKNPQSSLTQFHLGMAYLASGKRDRGRKLLESALRSGLNAGDARAAREALEKTHS